MAPVPTPMPHSPDNRSHADSHVDRQNAASLILFAASSVFLVASPMGILGWPAWVLGLISICLHPNRATRIKWLVLFALLLLLHLAPINTDRDNAHFLSLSACFAAAVFVPHWIFKWTGVPCLDWRFLPQRFSWRDVIYTLISIPLAWGVITGYFFHLNPELPTHWPMPPEPSEDAITRLVIGINAVGIWDELFFINVTYATLRSMLPCWAANMGQGIVYTSVLYHMAFTGAGPWIIYPFALTQGIMYEKSRCLLYVLIVHIVVDAFLVLAILQYFYPNMALRFH